VDNLITETKFARSFTGNFPLLAVDPGPSLGQFPTDPTLTSGTVSEITPAVRAYIDATYPPGTLARNTSTVTWTDPDHFKQPYFHQISAGYERELLPGWSGSVDYIRMLGRDMYFNPDLNIGLRDTTNRNATVRRNLNAFGILDEPYAGAVRLLTTEYGYSNYDALNLSLEKRYSNNWSLRSAYSRGYSRGITAGQGDTPQFQEGSNLNLDQQFAPVGTDRKHNFTVSGRMEIPRTGGVTLSGMLRMLSGTPFTVQDDTLDNNRNGILTEPLPAGTYNAFPAAGEHVYRDVETNGGRNGAYGPGFVQLDLRVGYRARLGGRRTLDIFADIFNATDRVNFQNPGGNRRVQADFLRFANLTGGSGFPRQVQLGARFGF
jgi:hypothetical protein